MEAQNKHLRTNPVRRSSSTFSKEDARMVEDLAELEFQNKEVVSDKL